MKLFRITPKSKDFDKAMGILSRWFYKSPGQRNNKRTTVTLRSGKSYNGHVLSKPSFGQIQIEDGRNRRNIKVSDISKVEVK